MPATSCSGQSCWPGRLLEATSKAGRHQVIRGATEGSLGGQGLVQTSLGTPPTQRL